MGCEPPGHFGELIAAARMERMRNKNSWKRKLETNKNPRWEKGVGGYSYFLQVELSFRRVTGPLERPT